MNDNVDAARLRALILLLSSLVYFIVLNIARTGGGVVK